MKLKDRIRGYLPVVVDVETGGFNENSDALLEICAIIIGLDDNEFFVPKTTLHFHITPFKGANIEPSALKFNGIDEGFRVHIPETILGVGNSITVSAWLRIPETSKSADVLWLGYDQITEEQLNFLYRFESWTPNTWSIVANYTLDGGSKGLVHHEIENITLSSGWNFYTISLNIDGTYSIMVNDVEVKGGVIENLSRWNVDVDACLVSGGVDFTLFDMGSLFI